MDSGKDSHSFGVVRFERGLMVTNDEGRRECKVGLEEAYRCAGAVGVRKQRLIASVSLAPHWELVMSKSLSGRFRHPCSRNRTSFLQQPITMG